MEDILTQWNNTIKGIVKNQMNINISKYIKTEVARTPDGRGIAMHYDDKGEIVATEVWENGKYHSTGPKEFLLYEVDNSKDSKKKVNRKKATSVQKSK